MRVRFYVMRTGALWLVRREAKAQGAPEAYDAALLSALYMASIEADRNDQGAEVFVEDGAGRLVLERTFTTTSEPPRTNHQPPVIRVGHEEVLAQR